MTEPEDNDIDWDGKNLKKKWEQDSLNQMEKLGYKKKPQWGIETPLWGYGGNVDDVKKNIFSTTDYPEKNFVFVKGSVEQTIPNTIPKKISLLRLDTDWYTSTYHELEHLYPILTKGGILVIDDYGWCRGARQATDEYMKKNNEKILLNRIDESVRLAIKI